MRTFILTQFLIFHLSFFVCLGNTAVEKETLPEDLTLDNILRSTLLNNGQIKESLQDIEIARGQLEQARAIFYPKATAMMLAAPIFKETGNAVASVQDWSTWGPYLSGGVQVVQPIYTFGMGSSYKKAAEGQLNANTHLSEMKKDEILYMAKEMYYGFLMANDFEKLVDDLIQYLDEAVQSTESKKGKGKNAVKQHDIYRLKTALDDLKQKKLYAIQGKQTAEKAVGWVSGLKFQKLPSQAFLPQDFEKLSLDEYLKLAKAHRPEFKALAAGKEARSALRDAKRAHSYPVIFVGAMAEVNWSPVRDRQSSIFANDPFNRIWGGGGIGFKWDLEFKKHSAEAQEQAAELAKLQAKESYAVPGIDLQVKRAFWEVEQAEKGLEIAKNRKMLAKKWFTSNAMGWSIGVTSSKDLMESLEGNGLAKKNYIETVYSLNIALAKLSQAVGKEITALNYR